MVVACGRLEMNKMKWEAYKRLLAAGRVHVRLHVVTGVALAAGVDFDQWMMLACLEALTPDIWEAAEMVAVHPEMTAQGECRPEQMVMIALPMQVLRWQPFPPVVQAAHESLQR